MPRIEGAGFDVAGFGEWGEIRGEERKREGGRESIKEGSNIRGGGQHRGTNSTLYRNTNR